eukprot:2548676-Rhodomonas_salina.3
MLLWGQYRSTLWQYAMAVRYGSTLWQYAMAVHYGSTLWQYAMAVRHSTWDQQHTSSSSCSAPRVGDGVCGEAEEGR